MSVFKVIDNIGIVDEVITAIKQAKKEILTTMDMTEELTQPLPAKYHELLQEKLHNGITVKRLGYGTKDEYAQVQQLYDLECKGYTFRFSPNVIQYQRLILIDKKMLFTKIGNIFCVCRERAIIQGFEKYFFTNFQEGKTI